MRRLTEFVLNHRDLLPMLPGEDVVHQGRLACASGSTDSSGRDYLNKDGFVYNRSSMMFIKTTSHIKDTCCHLIRESP